jgi:hypothetical protein
VLHERHREERACAGGGPAPARPVRRDGCAHGRPGTLRVCEAGAKKS